MFSECHRVLKDDGVLVFTFHHNKVWAWESIAEILLDAGFYVSATPIVRSEGKSGYHSSEGNIRYDAVLVCRKQPGSYDGLNEVRQRILNEAIAWTNKTIASGMAVNRADVFTIIMAKSVEHLTKLASAPDGNFERADLRTVLREVGEAVDEVCTLTAGDQTYSPEMRQLALLLKEAERRYGKST